MSRRVVLGTAAQAETCDQGHGYKEEQQGFDLGPMDTFVDTTTSTDPNNRNVGDLLNAKGVTWGWFQGGFDSCTQTHASVAGVVSKD